MDLVRDTGKHVLPDELGVDVVREPAGDKTARDCLELLDGKLDALLADERHDLLGVGALLHTLLLILSEVVQIHVASLYVCR